MTRIALWSRWVLANALGELVGVQPARISRSALTDGN